MEERDRAASRPIWWENYLVKGVHPGGSTLGSTERFLLKTFLAYLSTEGWSTEEPFPDYVRSGAAPDAIATRDASRMFIEVKAADHVPVDKVFDQMRHLLISGPFPPATRFSLVVPKGSIREEDFGRLASEPRLEVYEVDRASGVVARSA